MFQRLLYRLHSKVWLQLGLSELPELQGPGARILAAPTLAGVQPPYYCERNGVVGIAAEVGVPGQLRYVIRGLKTGQKYGIRVRAHNNEGYGYAASISPSFQIPRSTPSAPLGVELLALSSRLLKLRWRDPASDGGTIITSYQVQWDTSANFTSLTSGNLQVGPTDVAHFYFNIPVASATKYFVRVFAVNEQGDGDFGIPSPSGIIPSDQTPDRPEAATATVLSGFAILVEWKVSSTEKSYFGGDGGLPITQYMIEWDRSQGFDSPPAFGLVDGTKRLYIIGGDDAFTGVRSDMLIAGLTYSIRVTAFNAKGAGVPQPTTPSSVTVADQPPSAPQNLKLSFVSADSLQADWTNPLYDGGSSLKSYQIEWDEQDDFSSGQSSSATIPIIREMQSITLQNDVVNEEQFVDATVKVTNEEQVVRTTFTGVDEIQVIKTTNQAVVDEVQFVQTSATDRNEVQELRLDGDDVDEIQAIRTTVPEALEVQTLQVGVARVYEVQTISLTLPGAFADPAHTIAGTIFFSFDSSICTHCVKKMYQRTGNLITSLQTTSGGESIVETALEGLANIDAVTVTRTQNTVGPDLTYVYSVTFTGLTVAGNVPSLGIDAAVTVSGASVSGLPTQATQATVGSELAYSAAALFTVTYTCESYSDPNAITTFSTPCTPSANAVICAACVTAFDGTKFTISQDLSAVAYVATGAKLIAGVCSFEAGAVTPTTGVSTTITVAANDVGAYCSQFLGQTLALYKAPQMSRDIPFKTTATTISSGSVVEGLLTGAIDSVTVARSELVTATFVGSLYTVTIRKRSGTVPLLKCVATTPATCTVARTVVGSMITGTFKVGLVSQADETLVSPTPQYTADIPWDASETVMKSSLEAVTQNLKQVFGTVNVKRTVYAPTGNKWSGGFTWQITFTSRGWNIPMMISRIADPTTNVKTLKSSHSPTIDIPSTDIEDATHPLDPFANSRDGNQVMGTLMLKFKDVASTLPCLIGTQTSLATLDTRVRDSVLETFIQTNLKIPTIQIMRSAATQARGFTWTITFSDPTTAGDVGLLQIVSSTLTGQSVRTGVYETVKGNQLGGSFQLSFNGETTAPIPFGAEASDMETELNKLGTILPSSVIVSRGPPTSDQVLGYTWYITFHSSVWEDPTSDHSKGIDGNWKSTSRAKWSDVWESGYSKAWGRHVGHPPLITCITDGLTTSALDGSQSCVANVTTKGVGPIGGTFAVSLDTTVAVAAHMAVSSAVTSGDIAHNAWATKEQSGNTGTSVEEILESMANVGDVAVSRGDVDTTNGCYEWTVTFLRDASDATHPCEQLEESAGSQLCNAPGNVPQMGTVGTSLTGSTSTATVRTVVDGTILRGDFTDFRVEGDAGTAQTNAVTVTCPNTAPCTVTSLTLEAGGTLELLPQDRFTVGSFTSCIFQVVSVVAQTINVGSTTCAGMNTGANTHLGISMLLPWNADENLVERVLEAAATTTGRKVLVQRTVHGKYGEMSWHIRFISNPSFTPPGAGNLPDISTTFAAEAGSNNYDVTVTQVTPGSDGLSGSFLLDFKSFSFGPREISFDEDPDRLQRKLNEMDTIGRVTVKRFKYPSTATGCDDSTCSGGWGDQPVQNPGTRGGYRWRIRFMQATGDYNGYTFPPGSGNVASLSVSRSSTLLGTGVSVDVYTNVPGSSPTTGSFALNTTENQTPSLPYSASAEAIELGIEAMDLFGQVDVTRSYLLTQKIPGATATLTQDGVTATITGVDDIRQFIAPTDIIRFGPSSANNLLGTNGDAPFTGIIDTSRVNVVAQSPIVIAADPQSTAVLFPGMQLRIDGLVYEIQRTGHEVQTITTTVPVGSWLGSQDVDYYALKFTRAGTTYGPTTCFAVNTPAATLQAKIQLILQIQTQDVLVSRSGPVSDGTTKGYVYSVYFVGDSVTGDVAKLQAPTLQSCTGFLNAAASVDVVTDGGKLPHQRIMLATDYGQVVDSTGYYKITFNNQDSSCIKWGAPASDMESELENTLNTGDVIVTRSGNGTSQTEIQRIRMTANAEVTGTNGLFQVQFTLNGQTSATTCLPYGILAEDLEAALNGLSDVGVVNSIDHINVTRAGDGQEAWGYGYEYFIHFQGPISGGFSLVLGGVPQLEVGNVGTGACASGAVAGIYPAIIVETVRQGYPGFTYDIFFLDYKAAPVVSLVTLKNGDNDNVCLTGWKPSGGSVRKVSAEIVELGGSSEVQILTVADSTVTGAYKITYGAQTSSCLRFTATETTVAAALVTLTSSTTGDILVSRDTDYLQSPNGYIYRITFVGELVTGDLPLIGVVQASDTACANTVATSNLVVSRVVAGGALTGDFALTSVYDGENPNTPHVAYGVSQQFSVMDEQFEIQQLILWNPSNNIAADAKYKLTLLGTDTNLIPWDASESALQSELISTVQRALGITVVVDASDIIVTRRTNADAAPHGFVYTIYFSGSTVAGNVGAIQVVAAVAPNIGATNVLISTVRNGVGGVSALTASSIPLALPDAPTTASPYLSSSEQQLEVYKVNGFLWTIKFKSSLGNVPKLGKQTSALSGGTMAIQDDFVQGSASTSYVIRNLLAGINYYAHVAAWTDVGVGAFTPSTSAIPSTAANGVQNIASGYALYQREVQEVRLAASHITEIQEITTQAASIPEVQTLQTSVLPASCPGGSCIRGRLAFRVPTVQTVRIWATAPITQGTYTLLFQRNVASGNTGIFSLLGTKTAAIPFNADAAAVKTALISVANPAVTAADIVVTRDGDGTVDFRYGFTFQITFVGNNVAGETLPIVCGDNSMAGTVGVVGHCDVSMNTDTAMGTDTAVQQVIVKASKPLAVGSYKLHFTYLGAEKLSGCIPFDASADAMDAALEAMPNIDSVFVTREDYMDNTASGFLYKIFFHGNGVYGDTPLLEWKHIVCTAFQTQVQNALTSVGVNGEVDISMLDYGGFNADNTFVEAAFATVDQLTTDLNRLPVFGNVLVSQSLADEQGGYIWTVAFKDSEGNLPQFICAVDSTFAAVTNAGCTTDTLTDGNVLSGSFLIESSSPIPFNADAATIKSTLEAKALVGTVQVKQSAPSPQQGYTWTITFLDYKGDVPTLLVTSSLVGT
ncbi:hypothetical protein PR003_g22649, partial [Phytophthora rubi]